MKNSFVVSLCAMLFIVCSCTDNKVFLSWGDTNVRYERDCKPQILKDRAFCYPAWKGERVSAEAVLFSEDSLENVSVRITDLRSSKSRISAECASASFVRYVWADKMIEGYDQCGPRVRTEHDSLLVADRIDIARSTDIPAQTCQPLWISIKVPSDIPAGVYTGKLIVCIGKFSRMTLPLELEVTENHLPEPSDWKFHLDLWQNPYSVARYHGVEPWSEEHFEYMRPVMQLLAQAGQKAITTTIMDRPWNGQTQDPFESMVIKTKRIDGTWEYDYTIFDKWVSFMMSLGIDEQISCYSMIPWHLEFDYFDEKKQEVIYLKADTGSNEYKLYWGSFLSDFACHLREKGWFDRTVIAMDERPLESMRNAIQLIHSIEPDFKIGLAGRWHPEIEKELYDYCVAFKAKMPQEMREKRRQEGKISTVYTCCAERYPNTFTTSPLAEATWISWHALAKGYDGYLRWAFNSWTSDPMNDTRFRRWTAGDCFCVYPEGGNSLRFAKLVEGIQDYEKTSILRQQWEQAGDMSKCEELNDILSSFTYENLTREGAENAVCKAKMFIADLK